MQKSISYVFILLTLTAFIFSGCKRGEEDPFFTIHTRDGRMSQPWKLVGLNGTKVETTSDTAINTEYTFDGTNLYITTSGVTTSYAYIFTMEVKDNGEVFSEEFRNDPIDGKVVSESSNTGFWFWASDDKNKSGVNLDLTGLLSPYIYYDIPRLAWNDMTLSILASDNFSDSSGVATSVNTNLELKFEINLDVVN